MSLFQVYILSRENTYPENMCGIVFEKTKGRGETANRTIVYAEAGVRGFLQKKCYEKFRRIHKKSLFRNLFF